MKNVILTCDVCGQEIVGKGDRNHFTYMIYKYVDGLYIQQDLCSLCHIKLYDKIEEMKDE
jgi:hypothetical protein